MTRSGLIAAPTTRSIRWGTRPEPNAVAIAAVLTFTEGKTLSPRESPLVQGKSSNPRSPPGGRQRCLQRLDGVVPPRPGLGHARRRRKGRGAEADCSATAKQKLYREQPTLGEPHKATLHSQARVAPPRGLLEHRMRRSGKYEDCAVSAAARLRWRAALASSGAGCRVPRGALAASVRWSRGLRRGDVNIAGAVRLMQARSQAQPHAI